MFTTEAWFKTSTTRAARSSASATAATGNCGSYDRHVYMNNAGRLVFGVYPGSVQTSPRPAATTTTSGTTWSRRSGPSGMALYVDGASVGSRPT